MLLKRLSSCITLYSLNFISNSLSNKYNGIDSLATFNDRLSFKINDDSFSCKK